MAFTARAGTRASRQGHATPLVALCFISSLALGCTASGQAASRQPGGSAPGGSSTASRASPQPVRLLVAANVELRSEREWLRGLSLAVAEADALLYPYLGRHLEVARTVPWQGSVRQASADNLLMDLIGSVPRADADIIVGFVRSYSFQGFTETGDSVSGLANYRSAYAVIMLGGRIGAYHSPLAEIGSLLAHELAHIFGAIHRIGPELLLAPGGTGNRIDALNAALIGMHRNRSFGTDAFPLPEPYHEAARPLYRQAIADDPTDLDARLMLARLDVETGRYDEAIVALEAILAQFPGNLEARADLELALEPRRRDSSVAIRSPRVSGPSVRESRSPDRADHRKADTCS